MEGTMYNNIAFRTASLMKSFVLLLAMLAATASAALAIDLETARSRGLVGEADNGYIAIPPGAGTEARPLVGTVNQERRAVYAEIAEKNGITLDAAGQRTFEKRYPAFPAGTWVQIQGKWSKK
jgi:uncharacterized protein YdbL (DUF1318 family)